MLSIRPSHSALVLLTLAGCTSETTPSPAAPAAVDTGLPSTVAQSTVDTADAEAEASKLVMVPQLLRDAVQVDGRTRVIVEMQEVVLADLQFEPKERRQELLEARASVYAGVRQRIMERLSSGTSAIKTFSQVPFVTLEVTHEADLDALAQDPRVMALHVDEVMRPSLAQSLDLINQPEAEAAGQSGAGTAVVILDTGLNYTHSDFGSCTAVNTPSTCRVVYVADTATNDGSLDAHGHGTNVAAIVGKVAPGTDLIGLDVFDGGGAYTTDVIEGIDWSIANRDLYNIVAINMSLGGGAYTAECAGSAFDVAIQAALDAGIASAVATGNDGWTNRVASPACAPSAMKVGAVYDSNIGGISWSGCSDSTTAADKVTCFSNSASFIDLLAPGAMIVAGGYTMGGTSQATPHVAGALAVMASAYPNETPGEWLTRLQNTGVSITDHRNGLTFPRIDIEAAVADATACSITLSGVAASVVDEGATGSVGVSADSSCLWEASSNAAWLTVSPSSGTGNGTVNYTVAQNTGAERTAVVTIDDSTYTVTQAENPAPVGTIAVNGGVSWTTSRTVALTLGATDDNSGVSQMCIANVEGVASPVCTTWVTYNTVAIHNLSTGQGNKSVGVWYKDGLGRVSSMVSANIGLDTLAPSGAVLSASAMNAGAVLTWTAATDSGSGIARYRVVSQAGGTAPSGSCDSGTLVYEGTDRSVTLSSLTNDADVSFRLCTFDNAGNVDDTVTATVRPSASAGGPGTLTINGGAAWTRTNRVSLSMAPGIENAVEMCVSATSTCSSWQALQSTMSWSLPTVQGNHELYLWYRNAVGQTSAPAVAAIGYDIEAPSLPIVTSSTSSGAVALSWSGVTDNLSGVAENIVVMVEGARPPSRCTLGTEIYRGADTSASATGLTDGTAYSFRVCSVDAAGNISTGGAAVAMPLAGGASGPSLVINDGAARTSNRMATLTIDGDGANYMCIGTSNKCRKWTPVLDTLTYRLPGRQGEVMLYAFFADASLTPVSLAADSIIVDTRKAVDGVMTVTKGNQALDLSWTDAKDLLSGVASYVVVQEVNSTTAPATCSVGEVVYEGSDLEVSLTGLTNSQPYAFRVCAIDGAGNVSAGTTGIGWPGTDTIAPMGSFALANNEPWVMDTMVTATVSASDSGSGVRDVCVGTSDLGCDTWQAFASEMSVDLGKKSGELTRYLYIRDNEGNVSEPIGADIGLDRVRPSKPVVTVTAGATSMDISWLDSVDRHSGMDGYSVVLTEAPARLRACEGTPEVYAGTNTSTTVSSLKSGTTYVVGVCAKDTAGNVSVPAVVNVLVGQ